jgi:hypothetical protein
VVKIQQYAGRSAGAVVRWHGATDRRWRRHARSAICKCTDTTAACRTRVTRHPSNTGRAADARRASAVVRGGSCDHRPGRAHRKPPKRTSWPTRAVPGTSVAPRAHPSTVATVRGRRRCPARRSPTNHNQRHAGSRSRGQLQTRELVFSVARRQDRRGNRRTIRRQSWRDPQSLRPSSENASEPSPSAIAKWAFVTSLG